MPDKSTWSIIDGCDWCVVGNARKVRPGEEPVEE